MALAVAQVPKQDLCRRLHRAAKLAFADGDYEMAQDLERLAQELEEAHG